MKYELTHESMTGRIILWFDNDTGQLTRADFEAKLTDTQIKYFKNAFPTHEEHLNDFKTTKKFVIRMLDETITFKDFYEIYGRKEKKIDAEAAWNSLSPLERQLAVAYKTRYDRILQLNTKRERMLLGTYLRARMWLDNQ